MPPAWNQIVSKQLQLTPTLSGGQSFRWKKDELSNWYGVFNAKLWRLWQDDLKPAVIHFEVIADHNASGDNHQHLKELQQYFHLGMDMEKHFEQWAADDSLFKQVYQKLYGVRVLKQELTETIFAFICSSNNNIPRITSLVEKLASLFGTFICKFKEQSYYAFPTITQLNAPDLEVILKENAFGYRAKHIANSVKYIVDNGGDEWIEKVKSLSYADATIELHNLPGVGPKVADCICLMALGHLSAVPVDTHVLQIAATHYLPELPKRKSITKKTYSQISNHFQNLFGPYAGWAQTVLFCGDLRKLQSTSK